ncbi:DivIVA domain-containing protein [Melissococcus plutonius]|uniref:Cell division initiation protein DivIVA n=2 Tax=Melissococcus plutonius TaxID=33970 RepID=F3Y9R7_MELPT|nr:DivIVA domain-containing protein [Melissococcus plutonius]BAL62376.1 cell division initiation protein DivIVA [Melissococcus plutonius DAT561]AIM24780.1 cell division protein DivIVA [Melissococcus plutonius S1]KMT24894.1 cell division protein DivIVA [Melissococcus plutonius]KMT26531.1 cell division protein DivIVA [Melissococcus plutonius]KMT27781.1 cell division protein DivIVA [Melissococcus plutonius]
MALTPLDIQNKNFATKMRGYNQDEVDDFLDQITKDYEELQQRNKEIEKSLKHSEEKLQYFNELKDALNQSIIVAQDTADKVKDSATKESDMIVTTAENTANELISSAERKSNDLISAAEKKATEILTHATENARHLILETDELKKKTRVFHQRLSLMLETQLEQVKSDEWDDILKPISGYINDADTIIQEVLAGELNISENDTTFNTPKETQEHEEEEVVQSEASIDNAEETLISDEIKVES